MPSRSRVGTCLLSAALVAAGLGAGPAPATAAPAAAPAAALVPAASAPGAPRTVTLITGDRFRVSPDGGTVTRLPSPGRDQVPFFTDRTGGRLTVTPADALPLVDAGKVDPRLFDVTTLIESGYDDRRADLPLIISSPGGDTGKVRTLAETADATVTADLKSVAGVAVSQDKDELDDLWNSLTTTGGPAARTMRSEIGKIWLDGRYKPLLERSTGQIKAPEAWAAGFDGTGVKVGVVDSGVDVNHPDLKGRVIARSFVGNPEDLTDQSGHGTHVASTIAGSGAASGGKNKGVAPGATVYSAKVCTGLCTDSAIAAGIDWLYQQGVKVINLSLGQSDTPGEGYLEQIINGRSRFGGLLFVVASGNAGDDPVPDVVSSPASADMALAVGAVDSSDAFAAFTSAGPSRDGRLKPEIVAPGVEISAAGAGTGGYRAMSGTSMAAPHVAGAAALLLQQHPDWRGDRIKATLVGAADPIDANVYQQGAGRVNVGRALKQTVTTAPATLGYGAFRPSVPVQPIPKTITYRNPGTTPLTLDLTVQATGPTGAPAPADMFRPSPSRLIVPAGGEATATVFGDPGRATGPGLYGGPVVATSDGEVVVRTPVGLERRPDEYYVTIEHLGRSGTVPGSARTWLVGLDGWSGEKNPEPLSGGRITYAVPKGRYAVLSNVADFAGLEAWYTMLVNPEVTVDRDMTITMDARAGKPIDLSVEKAGGAPIGVGVNAIVHRDGKEELGFGIGGADFSHVFAGKIGTGSADAITSTVIASFAPKQADGSFRNAPWTVNAAVREPKTVLDGYQRVLRDSELTAVQQVFAEEMPGSEAVKAINPVWPGVQRPLNATSAVLDLPARRTDFYTTADGVRWDAYVSFAAQDGAGEWAVYQGNNQAQEVRYEPGRTYTETWNKGVYGPSFATAPFFDGVYRDRNGIQFAGSLRTDSAGRFGNQNSATTRLVLTRNGAVIEERPYPGGVLGAPGDEGRYQLTIETTRTAPAQLNTAAKVSWGFDSKPVTGDGRSMLPLSVVRFLPPLDDRNTAVPGSLITVPYKVETQAGSAAKKVRRLSVEVSFDDGKTWTKGVSVRVNGTGLVMVARPAGTGFVSLRSSAEDAAGTTVAQEVLRAFRY